MKSSRLPNVICHMMTTIDGKITSGDVEDILDEYFDLYTKTEDMLPPHSAWMCGRVTMQMFASKDSIKLSEVSDETIIADYTASHTEKLYMFGVDTKGLLRWDKHAIKLSNVADHLHIVIIVTKNTPRNYLQHLRDTGISYIVVGEDVIDFGILFEKIKTLFSVETVLLEGGGILNGSVMNAGFVEEISLLLTPIALNKSSAPSIFEQKVNLDTNIKKFSLVDVQKMEKGCVWLRYQRT